MEECVTVQVETAEGLSGRLDAVKARISAAAVGAGRPAEAVDLVAISKTQPDERISAALAAGQRLFGENRDKGYLARTGCRRRGPIGQPAAR